MGNARCPPARTCLIALMLAAGCAASEGSSDGDSNTTAPTGESTSGASGESGSTESSGSTGADVPMACAMAELPMGLFDGRCRAYYDAAECCGHYEFDPDNDGGAEEGCELLYDSPEGCKTLHDGFVTCFVETARTSCADAAVFWEVGYQVAAGEPLPPGTPCFDAIQAAIDGGCAVPPSVPPR